MYCKKHCKYIFRRSRGLLDFCQCSIEDINDSKTEKIQFVFVKIRQQNHFIFRDLNSIWAWYLHACIKQVQGEYLTNSSLRKRFGLEVSSSGSISRLIKEAVELNYIKPLDPNTAPRYMKYIPIWA